MKTCRIQNRTYHGQVGSGSPVERPGGVAQDWVPAEVFANATKVEHTFYKESKTRRSKVSREALISDILCKPTEEPYQRLTSGLSAVYRLGEKRSLFLPADQ